METMDTCTPCYDTACAGQQCGCTCHHATWCDCPECDPMDLASFDREQSR